MASTLPSKDGWVGASMCEGLVCALLRSMYDDRSRGRGLLACSVMGVLS